MMFEIVNDNTDKWSFNSTLFSLFETTDHTIDEEEWEITIVY